MANFDLNYDFSEYQETDSIDNIQFENNFDDLNANIDSKNELNTNDKRNQNLDFLNITFTSSTYCQSNNQGEDNQIQFNNKSNQISEDFQQLEQQKQQNDNQYNNNNYQYSSFYNQNKQDQQQQLVQNSQELDFESDQDLEFDSVDFQEQDEQKKIQQKFSEEYQDQDQINNNSQNENSFQQQEYNNNEEELVFEKFQLENDNFQEQKENENQFEIKIQTQDNQTKQQQSDSEQQTLQKCDSDLIKMQKINKRRDFLQNYKKKNPMNSAHIPTNFMNVLIPYMINFYEKNIKCLKNPKNSDINIISCCYKICQCQVCKEYSILRQKKSSIKNQSIKDLREFWLKFQRFQVITQDFLISGQANQLIKHKNTYRNLNHKQSLIQSLPKLLKAAQKPQDFVKLS